MTFPAPQTPALQVPARLSWVTVPLIVMLVLQVIGVLLLPLLVPLISAIAASPDFAASMNDSATDPASVRTVLGLLSAFVWVIEVFQIALAVLYVFVLRAVQAGRSWGRVAAIVLFVLGILNFPLGTLLGVFGLIGAFDAEVTAYCNR